MLQIKLVRIPRSLFLYMYMSGLCIAEYCTNNFTRTHVIYVYNHIRIRFSNYWFVFRRYNGIWFLLHKRAQYIHDDQSATTIQHEFFLRLLINVFGIVFSLVHTRDEKRYSFFLFFLSCLFFLPFSHVYLCTRPELECQNLHSLVASLCYWRHDRWSIIGGVQSLHNLRLRQVIGCRWRHLSLTLVAYVVRRCV